MGEKNNIKVGSIRSCLNFIVKLFLSFTLYFRHL